MGQYVKQPAKPIGVCDNCGRFAFVGMHAGITCFYCHEGVFMSPAWRHIAVPSMSRRALRSLPLMQRPGLDGHATRGHRHRRSARAGEPWANATDSVTNQCLPRLPSAYAGPICSDRIAEHETQQGDRRPKKHGEANRNDRIIRWFLRPCSRLADAQIGSLALGLGMEPAPIL